MRDFCLAEFPNNPLTSSECSESLVFVANHFARKDKSAVRELHCFVQHHFHAWLPSTTVGSSRRGKQINLDFSHVFNSTMTDCGSAQYTGKATSFHPRARCLKTSVSKDLAGWSQKSDSFSDFPLTCGFLKSVFQNGFKALLKSFTSVPLTSNYSEIKINCWLL